MPDVVVIGGGINGLAAAAFLAKSGRKVLVYEARPVLGGLAAREEFHPGFHAPGLLHDASLTRRELLAPLGLEKHGLVWRTDAPPLLVAPHIAPGAAAGGAQASLLLHRDPARTRFEGESGSDAAAYRRWRDFLGRVSGAVVRVIDRRPPDVASSRTGDLAELARTALALRRLGKRDMLELMRIAPMPAADWMRESFESELLRAGLVAPALIGITAGPRGAGTSAAVCLREVASGPEPRGGPAALAVALAAACRALGVEIELGAPVARIRVRGGRVEGVELRRGDAIDAAVVASSADPRRTLLDLLAPAAAPLSLVRVAEAWKVRGSTAAVRVALSAPPKFAAASGEAVERVCTAGSLVDLERGADHLKHGRLPERPWLDIRVPSAQDESLAPKGSAVLSILVHSVPHALRSGWTPAARASLTRVVQDALERAAPGTRERTVGVETLAPPDIEERFGVADGHVLHGEHALDQLWVQRPAIACARYATPIEGLFLCGSGSHPGGGFFGGPGALAAAAILGR